MINTLFVLVPLLVLVLYKLVTSVRRYLRVRRSEENQLFSRFCKLTCEGGSECGTCPCNNPEDCQLRDHSGFPRAQNLAVRRMKEMVIRECMRTGKVVVGECVDNKITIRHHGEPDDQD